MIRVSAFTNVVVPTYGNHRYSHDLVADIVRESNSYPLRVVVVDNHVVNDPNCDPMSAEGPYEAVLGETVLRPGSNVKWSGSCNLGMRLAFESSDCDSCVLLDNDTRLSRGFFEGLRATWQSTGAGLVCPLYSQDWTHQLGDYRGRADKYVPRDVNRTVPFSDGTCMFVPRSTYELVGELDGDLAPNYGWGVDIDYSMRTRNAGLEVRVTELAYMEHFRAATNAVVDHDYFENADFEFRVAMVRRYGQGWVDRVWDGFPAPEIYEELIGFHPPALDSEDGFGKGR